MKRLFIYLFLVYLRKCSVFEITQVVSEIHSITVKLYFMKHWSWDGSLGYGPQKRAVLSACSDSHLDMSCLL